MKVVTLFGCILHRFVFSFDQQRNASTADDQDNRAICLNLPRKIARLRKRR